MPQVTISQSTLDELGALAKANPPATPAPAPAQVNAALAPFIAAHPGAAFMMEINSIAQPGEPGTVTLSQTGHTLSLPHPEIGELILGYYVRTSLQTGGDISAEGGLAMEQSQLYSFGPTPDHWPAMVDEWAWRTKTHAPGDTVNPYAPVAVQATQAAAQPSVTAQWAAVYAEMQKNNPSLPTPVTPAVVEAT